MTKTKIIAELMLQPALAVLGGPCKEWRRKVRQFSYGLLPAGAESEVVAHVHKCVACRLFLLQCFKIQRRVSASIFAKNLTKAESQAKKKPELRSKLGSTRDVAVKREPQAGTRKRSINTEQHCHAESKLVKRTKKRGANGDV